MKFSFKNAVAFICSFFIIVIGLSFIYVNSKKELDKLAMHRNEYYIVTDVNKKDVLKIDKKVFAVSNIKYLMIKKVGSDVEFRVDDKKLISDMISILSFEKFTYMPNAVFENEEWTVEIGLNSNVSTFVFSNSSKYVKFNYNSTDFLIEVDDGFYNFMYEFFGKLES